MPQGKGKVQQALNLAGSQHKYQKIVILLIALAWIEVNYLLLGPTLIYMDPIFSCASTGDQVVQQAQACPIISECRLINHFTITGKMKLYCELEWARDLVQSIFSIGGFLGLVIMNMISDAKGRKIATLISFMVNFLGIISCFLGAFFNIIFFSVLGQFLIGFGAYSMVTLGYTLLADFLSESLRSKAIVLVNSVWGISTFMLGVYYLVQLRWQYYLLLIVFLPLLILSFGFYAFVVESPYILMNQNKPEQALFSLTAIAMINDRKHNIDEIRQILYSRQKRDESNQASVKNVLKMVKEWKYLKPIIILTVVYGIGNLNFFGIGYAFSAQAFGYGYNSIIAGCVQMVSFVFLGIAIEKLPRRKGIAGFYLIATLLGLAFLFPFVHNSSVASTILLALGRIDGTIAYTMIACLQIQSFTVEIQSTAAGLIQAFSLYGLLLAPLVVDFSDKIGIDPIAFMAIFLNFAIWPLYFLKETLVSDGKKKVNPLLEGDKQSQNQTVGNGQSRQTMITDITEKSDE